MEKLFINEYCYIFKIHNKDANYFYEENQKNYQQYEIMVEKFQE